MGGAILSEPKKAYVYTRVSTEMQVEGFSLDGQLSEIKEFCSRNNYTIVGEYSDKGKSGATIAKRDDFKRMLQDIELRKDGVDFVVVYKLSRFGRSLVDIMNSLQILNDNGVALRTVDGAINTSDTMGRLITSILAAVAEMELDNIHEQTFLGRQQKAREGRWNGGFAPYGYRISDGVSNEPDILVVEEEEAKIVRMIFDFYTNDKMGVAGIVTECDRLAIRKLPRKNSTLTRMNRKFVTDVLCNPVYCGKIAYGRRHLEKPDKTGHRKMSKPKDYILVDGRHEAIISYEQFQEAQRIREERAPMCNKRPDNEHVHLLATLIKCPVCGAGLYGNTTRKRKPNGEVYKDYHFYACKHRLKVNGQTCSFRTNINEQDIDEPVVAILSKLVNDPHLAELLSHKLDTSTDKQNVEEAINAQKKLIETTNSNIARLTSQLDHLDYSSPIAERKAADMEKRVDNLYNEVEQQEQYLEELYQRLFAINQNLLTKDSILNLLKQFDRLYAVMSQSDRQILIRTIVEEIQIYPEKQADGRVIKSIKLSLPVVYENGETPRIRLDKNTTVETVVLLSKGEVDSKKIRVEFSLEDMDMSEFQDGATYTQIKDYVLEHSRLKVSNLYISQIKRKCGIGVGKNYNLPKSEDSRQPQCPPEKEKAIREAFKYFGMI